MLTPYDISVMESDVSDIIKSWSTKVEVWDPKPEDEQPNWNALMREYTGEPAYNILYIPYEERSPQNIASLDVKVNMAGDKIDSQQVITIPQEYDLNEFMIFIYKGEQYHIKWMKSRIGETIVLLYKLVGGNDHGEI